MKTNKMIQSAMLIALTAVGAYLIIPLPFSPVPITLQTFFILLAGRLLGAKYAMLSQLGYLILGAVGLPIFAGGAAGPGILAGPTGGFLIGFIAMAGLAGIKTNDKRQSFFICTAAIITDYIIGCLYFMLLTGNNFLAALTMTIIPFIPGDIFKITLVIFIAPIIKRSLARH
ncbi:biotin transporter BioY [Halanaerobium salsuginis]|jgi:biotin transport system substrate-specific component|uniref:Biotin transporter n=1 Tax=Halanaerobium salsuginis TaxID=29563 RepID=A0A1I4I6G5_9FIRM|nr:biotin transporter BioY [Halanaerobium salsuginis]SFL50002.1 biotin transport system substrate-specific component [Halanaerobium salsuginis]